LSPQFTIDIARDGDSLQAGAPGGMKIPLFAESDTNFYVKGMYLLVRFKKDGAGKVVGFDAEQFNGTQFAQKVR